jgi:hypothetical protein
MTEAAPKEPEAVSQPDALAELIERLGKASGPDRDIDLAINVALWPDGDIAKLTLNHPRGFSGQEGMAWDFWHSGSIVFEKRAADGTCPYNGGYPLPAYTASIDAAVTLVPDGHKLASIVRGYSVEDPDECWYVVLLKAGGGVPSFREVGRTEACGETIATALCIAALMARQER